METTLTAEQQEDINARVEEFKKRHIANIQELEVDFVSYPQYVQTGPSHFSTVAGMHLVDTKYAPIPSPLNEEMHA